MDGRRFDMNNTIVRHSPASEKTYERKPEHATFIEYVPCTSNSTPTLKPEERYRRRVDGAGRSNLVRYTNIFNLSQVYVQCATVSHIPGGLTRRRVSCFMDELNRTFAELLGCVKM